MKKWRINPGQRGRIRHGHESGRRHHPALSPSPPIPYGPIHITAEDDAVAAAAAVAMKVALLRLPPTSPISPSPSSSPSTSLPRKPPKSYHSVSLPPPSPLHSSTTTSTSTSAIISAADFREKVLYLESLGLDLFALAAAHPPALAAPLPGIRSALGLLRSLGFSTADFRRILSMCPDLLSPSLSAASILPSLTFLLREAGVDARFLPRAVSRRPRLLASDVDRRLRPTLFFLQSLGVADVARHSNLLSCSVEEKFLPRIDYFERIGFPRRDAVSMFRRFPQLFCYSIEDNFEPKFDYFVVEMGRDLRELKEFPQYFSFSLDNRIKPRHRMCVEKGVVFPLPLMLKTKEAKFRERLEVCWSSSPPWRSSPLWAAISNSD